MSLDSFQFEDDDNPFTGTVDLDTMQHLGVRRPTTTLESDDSDELDEHTYQDEVNSFANSFQTESFS